VVTDKSGQKKEFTRKLDVASFLKTGAHKIEKIILEGKHKDYLVERYYNKHKFKKK
jgi:hypothetical protein